MHVHISICFGAKILQWWFTLDLWTSGKFACWEIHVLMLFPCTFCLNIHTLVHTWMHTRICILVKKDIANDGLHLISELQVSSIVEKHMYWCSVLAPCVRTHTRTHSSMQILVCICFGYCKWWFTLDLWTSGKFLLTSTCADALSLYLLFEYFYMQHIFICISVLCIKLKIR